MAVREFTDSKGVAWRVWKTRPSNPAYYPEERRNGWLTFECDSERRRLVPIPDGWEECSPERLELLFRVATEVSSRKSPEDPWTDNEVEPPRG